MTELNYEQIDAVSGGSLDDVYIVGAAAVAGAIGGSFLGPGGAVAGAISAGGHALLIRLLA